MTTNIEYWAPEDLLSNFVLSDSLEAICAEALKLGCRLEAHIACTPFGKYVLELQLLKNKGE